MGHLALDLDLITAVLVEMDSSVRLLFHLEFLITVDMGAHSLDLLAEDFFAN